MLCSRKGCGRTISPVINKSLPSVPRKCMSNINKNDVDPIRTGWFYQTVPNEGSLCTFHSECSYDRETKEVLVGRKS